MTLMELYPEESQSIGKDHELNLVFSTNCKGVCLNNYLFVCVSRQIDKYSNRRWLEYRSVLLMSTRLLYRQ